LKEVSSLRNKRFVGEYRGGLLTREQHLMLLKWACQCAEHVLKRFEEIPDYRLISALNVAKQWALGNASTGDARTAALVAFSVSRESLDPVKSAIARAVGHAVATAHMADHSLVASLYALKAVEKAGAPVDVERKWQNQKLPQELRELVMIESKGKKLK
jgi:predicted N-acetyltransferase YhbS